MRRKRSKRAKAPKRQTRRKRVVGTRSRTKPATSKQTKQQTCLDLLSRQEGATIEELQAATGWQQHSVRGFLAGAVKKKLGLTLLSEKPDVGTPPLSHFRHGLTAMAEAHLPEGKATAGPGGDLEVLRRLEALRDLSPDELRKEWRRLYRSQPPRLSRDLLVRAIAYRIQELRYGGLSKATSRKLAALVQARRSDAEIAPESAQRIRAGARLVREWNGRTHTVTVEEEGFTYAGRSYRSLTAIAREITGARWSGPRFFGLAAEERRFRCLGDLRPAQRRAGKGCAVPSIRASRPRRASSKTSTRSMRNAKPARPLSQVKSTKAGSSCRPTMTMAAIPGNA